MMMPLFDPRQPGVAVGMIEVPDDVIRAATLVEHWLQQNPGVAQIQGLALTPRQMRVVG